LREYSKHHIVPRSRGGRQGRTIKIPATFHDAWHKVFGNLYGEELVEFIREFNELMDKSASISGTSIERLRSKIRRK
jgi:hypothetical protein